MSDKFMDKRDREELHYFVYDAVKLARKKHLSRSGEKMPTEQCEDVEDKIYNSVRALAVLPFSQGAVACDPLALRRLWTTSTCHAVLT